MRFDIFHLAIWNEILVLLETQQGQMSISIDRSPPLPVLTQQLRIPVPLIFHVLHMTRGAVGFIGRDYLATGARVGLAVVAPGASRARSGEIDWVSGRMTT